MKKFMLLFALLSLTWIVGCGPKEGGSPYKISDEKAPVKVALNQGGQPYSPQGMSPTVALFGVGGFRMDLKPAGNGVFASAPESPVPHGEYAVTVMGNKGRTVITQTV